MSESEKSMMESFDPIIHPYRERFGVETRLPETGKPREDVLETLSALCEVEAKSWRQGYASGSVYHGDEDHINFVNRAYALQSQANQLHFDLWPSAAKFEAEIVSMTAHMLGCEHSGAEFGSEQGVCGSVSSGGSESILLAMKSYRDRARKEKGITEPEIVLPISAHAAFHKASQYFNIKLRITPLDSAFRADTAAMEAAINDNTIAMVGSACNFPYGTIDPIGEISAIALAHGIGLHVDSCLGGFFLPWAEVLGQPVEPFDFRLPGVTSMSCDTHKYGYAPKGTSVVLYRGMALRRYQYFTIAEWPGGMYFSPTFSGSRPGALSAACWAAMMATGRQGYLDATAKILEAVATMKAGVQAIDELFILGDPIGVFAFGSESLNVHEVSDQMATKGWSLTCLQDPRGVHVSPTLRHTQPGVAQRFVEDLQSAVAYVKKNPGSEQGTAPIYGLAAALPDRGVVHDLLKELMDIYYRT